jgi:hypothetical protein
MVKGDGEMILFLLLLIAIALIYGRQVAKGTIKVFGIVILCVVGFVLTFFLVTLIGMILS